MALFKGKVFTTHDSYIFYYIPQPDTEKEPVNLFNFSANTGLTEAGSPAGEKVMISVKPVGVADVLNGFPDANLTEEQQKGIFYRIPEPCVVSVEWDGEVLAKERIPVNQAGSIRCLPDRNFKAEFYPETGGIKSLIVK
jgi:hypothetical protein